MRIYYYLKDNWINSIRIDPNQNYNFRLEVYPDTILINKGDRTVEIQTGFFGNSQTIYNKPRDAQRDIIIHLKKIILRKHKGLNSYQVEGINKNCFNELKKFGITPNMILAKIKQK